MGKTTYHPDRSKYTKEYVAPIVASSFSYTEVLKKLGLRFTGSGNSRIREIVSRLSLDTSHFLGLRANSGSRKRGGNQKYHWSVILVRDRFEDGRKETVKRLRRAMVEFGVKETCKDCGLGLTWNGKRLVLQIDHVDGDCVNNTPDNLRFLCPNCHSQTPTFGSGNFQHKNLGYRKKGKDPRKKRIWRDGKRITVYESSGGGMQTQRSQKASP